MTQSEIATGTRVSFQIWNVEAKALTTQTGSVKRVLKGSNPLVLIEADRPELRQNPSAPLKVRISDVTKI